MGQLRGKYTNYAWIIAVLVISFVLHIVLLLIFYDGDFTGPMLKSFSPNVIHFIRVYLYGGIGSTIICTVFAAQDKDRTEKLASTADEKTLELEFPGVYDIWFYVTRIMTGSMLGVFAVLLYSTGLLVLKTEPGYSLTKNLAFVISFLIGFYQFRFLSYLNGLATKILEPGTNGDKPKEPGSNGGGKDAGAATDAKVGDGKGMVGKQQGDKNPVAAQMGNESSPLASTAPDITTVVPVPAATLEIQVTPHEKNKIQPEPNLQIINLGLSDRGVKNEVEQMIAEEIFKDFGRNPSTGNSPTSEPEDEQDPEPSK